MLINENIMRKIKNYAGPTRCNKAKDYQRDGRVIINKIMYGDKFNYSIDADVRGNYGNYNTYINIENGDLEDFECTCEDYYNNYNICKHIVATALEINSSSQYDVSMKDNKDLKYNDFKEIIGEFYNDIMGQDETDAKYGEDYGKVIIKPKLIIHSYNSEVKVEFKIGTKKQLYKLKDIPEFYRNMNEKKLFKYGLKLEFLHDEDAFLQEYKPMLNFLLKYASIMNSVKRTTNMGYRYFGQSINYSSIALDANGVDELFEIINDDVIEVETDFGTIKMIYLNSSPDIKFEINKINNKEYSITPTNVSAFKHYEILKGKENIYMVLDNKIYKCDKNMQKSSLKLLDIFKKNMTDEIIFPKEYFESFFSIVMPKLKENINTDKIPIKEIEEYIPKKLGVKLFLDYDEASNIILDVNFCYGDITINPFNDKDNNIKLARDVVSETETLNLFAKTGFLLDRENCRLILTDEEKIFEFLSNDIEEYMAKFEVLATEGFNQRKIKQPRIGSIGVRVENNLLQLDFSNMQIDKNEISKIMQKYQLKKKYHRLKDGSFLMLEGNEDIDMLNKLTTGLEIDNNELTKGTINLPVYRSLYLNKLLQSVNDVEIKKDDNYAKMTSQIESKGREDNIKIPKSLENTLRYYQKNGFKWLKTLDGYRFGGILADDMGLGKTIQMLSVILNYIENTKKEERMPSMVVSPSSLSLNWKSEAEKFTKDITTVVISGKLQEREEKIKNINKYDLVITSYDLLKRDIELYNENNCKFRYILADEAQYIKNSTTQNAKAIKKINAQTRYALTGTPIENSLEELWSIFDFIMPGYLFTYKKFKQNYEVPIIKEQNAYVMEKLKMLIEPFILRRTKKEVLTELPDKTITIMNNEMTKEQQNIYLAYLAQAKKELQDEVTQKGFEKSQIKILALLTRLRQICCHPALFLENYKSDSGKLNQCMELIDDAISGNHKILLFSGYTTMFGIIEKELKNRNIKYFKLTGKTKVDERVELVDKFNKDDEIKVFLISLKAGGTGLNLTGADVVIHYDPWWNLSVENQATDRAYRIGQKNNVQVYKLITKNSIEEKIYKLQQRKANLVDSMLDVETKFINKLSRDDIMQLFEK